MRSPIFVSPLLLVVAACGGPAPTDASVEVSPTREAGFDATTVDAVGDAQAEGGIDATLGADATAPDALDDVALDNALDVATDTADVGGDAEDAAADASPPLVRLTNVPEASPDCSMVLGPRSGEANHWVGVRLTPPSYPFHVRRVQYTTVGGTSCNAGASHFLNFAIATTYLPPSSAAGFGGIVVPNEVTTSPRVVTIDLAREIVVPAGYYFFVEIQYTSSPSELPPCFVGCVPEEPEANTISNSQSAPFIWNPAGRNADFLVEAFGVPE